MPVLTTTQPPFLRPAPPHDCGQVPPCPIAGGSQTFSVVLPSKSPIGILGVSAKGTVTVTDPKGAVLISADVNGSINDKMTAGDTSAVDDADEWVWDLSEAFSGDSAEPAKQPLFALRGAAAATAACGNDADHTLWEQSKASFQARGCPAAAAAPPFCRALAHSGPLSYSSSVLPTLSLRSRPFRSFSPPPQADMTACGKKCLGASACVKSCIKGKHAYSDGCAGCFGALAGCTKSYCMVKCINGNSPACTSYVSCMSLFVTPHLVSTVFGHR